MEQSSQMSRREIEGPRAQHPQHGRLLSTGLSDSRWELTTTLERAGCEHMLIADYYELVKSSRS